MTQDPFLLSISQHFNSITLLKSLEIKKFYFIPHKKLVTTTGNFDTLCNLTYVIKSSTKRSVN